MQVKDKYSKKINLYIFLIIIFFIKNIYGADIISKIQNHNLNLKNSSLMFIQTDGKTVEEGVIYIGQERIRIDYTKPNKISIIVTKKRGMYVNHELKEAEYFNTKKSFISLFFKILTGEKSYKNIDFEVFEDRVYVNDKFETNNSSYKLRTIYENDPIKIRKIIVIGEDNIIEMGLFGQNNLVNKKNSFFSLINPYLY